MAPFILREDSVHTSVADHYLKLRGLRQQRCNGLWLLGLKNKIPGGLCPFLEALVENSPLFFLCTGCPTMSIFRTTPLRLTLPPFLCLSSPSWEMSTFQGRCKRSEFTRVGNDAFHISRSSASFAS